MKIGFCLEENSGKEVFFLSPPLFSMLRAADRADSYNHRESFRLDQSQGLICMVLDYSQREKDTGVHTLPQVHFWALIMLPLACFQNQRAIASQD